MMVDSVYEQLAARLDAIPNGYPRTESRVELRLLEKLFTPEEAAIAVAMRLTPESPADIAQRAGIEKAAARRLLKGMIRNGLIGAKRGEHGLLFHLIPFVVGIYEFNLHRMDEEFAALFERYMQETRGGAILSYDPPVHRVIPIQESIATGMDIAPYAQASNLLEQARAWGVRDCICRVQQKLVGKGCDHPVEVCLAFSPVENWFDNDPGTRALTKQEALQVLQEAADAGLVHTIGNHHDGHFYICNCCICSCGILRGIAEFDIPTAVAHSDFRAVVDQDICSGCEDCVDRCQFDALSIQDMVAAVAYQRCVGCGQCVTTCSTGALSMEPRPTADRDPIPDNIEAWMVERAKKRGIDLANIL
jgi:electron transport complex protein RnfB